MAPEKQKVEQVDLTSIDTNKLIQQAHDSNQAAVSNPLAPVVGKIAEKGWAVDDAFDKFDADMDESLTIEEIKKGMIKHNINLSDAEWKLFIGKIDQNSDGVLTREEWNNILTP